MLLKVSSIRTRIFCGHRGAELAFITCSVRIQSVKVLLRPRTGQERRNREIERERKRDEQEEDKERHGRKKTRKTKKEEEREQKDKSEMREEMRKRDPTLIES